jgi:hypothetical protein
VRAVVNYRVCELEIQLELLVVTIFKSPRNPISNPNLVYSHLPRDSIFASKRIKESEKVKAL